MANAAVPNVRAWVASTPLWAQAIVAVVIGDFGIYVTHGLAHTLPWLWRFHVVHQSAEELDWLIAFRFHPLDLFLMRIGSLAPLVVFKLSPAAIAIFVAAFGWQSWLVHANVRIPYGPLRWAFVSPEFHHWHHSADREAFDRNYASIFAAWDFVFGTVHLPRRNCNEPAITIHPHVLANRQFTPFSRRCPIYTVAGRAAIWLREAPRGTSTF